MAIPYYATDYYLILENPKNLFKITYSEEGNTKKPLEEQAWVNFSDFAGWVWRYKILSVACNSIITTAFKLSIFHIMQTPKCFRKYSVSLRALLPRDVHIPSPLLSNLSYYMNFPFLQSVHLCICWFAKLCNSSALPLDNPFTVKKTFNFTRHGLPQARMQVMCSNCSFTRITMSSHCVCDCAHIFTNLTSYIIVYWTFCGVHRRIAL